MTKIKLFFRKNITSISYRFFLFKIKFLYILSKFIPYIKSMKYKKEDFTLEVQKYLKKYIEDFSDFKSNCIIEQEDGLLINTSKSCLEFDLKYIIKYELPNLKEFEFLLLIRKLDNEILITHQILIFTEQSDTKDFITYLEKLDRTIIMELVKNTNFKETDIQIKVKVKKI